MGNDLWTIYYPALPPYFAVSPIVIIVLILVNNILVLMAFKKMKYLQLQHYFMIGLATADLMTILPSIVCSAILLNRKIWLTEHLCAILGISLNIAIEMTTCVHSAMSVEKCLAISYPLRHRLLSKSKWFKYATCLVIIFCFIFPVTFNFALYLTNKVKFMFSPQIITCVTDQSENLISLLCIGVMFTFIPMIMQLATHIFMYVKLKKQRGANRKRMGKAMKTVVMTVGIYWIFWLPVACQIAFLVFVNWTAPTWYRFLAIQVVQANSAMSLLIYTSSLPNFSILPSRFNKNTARRFIHVQPASRTDNGNSGTYVTAISINPRRANVSPAPNR